MNRFIFLDGETCNNGEFGFGEGGYFKLEFEVIFLIRCVSLNPVRITVVLGTLSQEIRPAKYPEKLMEVI